MKRFIIGVASLTAIIITAVIFYACNKEQETPFSEVSSDPALSIKTESANDEFDLEKRIEILSKETGIDIRKIGDLSTIQELARQNQKTMDAIEKMDKSSSKGSLDGEINQLVSEIQSAYNAGNYELVMLAYEKLCSRCASIPGFVFDVNV